MKKVMMVSCEGLGRGGVQAVMMDVVRNLGDTYHFDMLLFTEDIRHYDAEFLQTGGRIIRIPFYNGSNPIRRKLDYYTRGYSLYRKIRKAMEQYGPYDVVHCNNIYESALCLQAAKELGVPIRIAHMHICAGMASGLRDKFDTMYLRHICKYATHKIACTACSGQTMYRGAAFDVINNAYDEKRFSPDHYPALEKKELLLTQIGIFNSNKNQTFSIEILRALRIKGVDAKLALVGFGDYSFLKKHAQQLGVAEYVSFLDADTDTPELLSRSAAFLFPSKKEGFGIVLLEAQAMGVACYVSDSVPEDADVGGCTYLSLDSGAEYWAEQILSDYEKNGGKTVAYDCSAFAKGNIMGKYRKLYRGECL